VQVLILAKMRPTVIGPSMAGFRPSVMGPSMAAIPSPIESREPSPGRRKKSTGARATKFVSNQSSMPTLSRSASPSPKRGTRGSQLEVPFASEAPAAAEGMHQGGTFDAPLERPWWMNIHGDGPPVADLDDVMDQFLCDPGAQAIENNCRKTVNRFDVRSMEKVLPAIEQDQLRSMQKWYGYMQDFTKYRRKVEKQMDLRMQRKHNKQDPWENSDSDDDDDSGSDAPGVAATGTMRSEVAESLSGVSSFTVAGTGSRALGAGASIKSGRRPTIAAKGSKRLTHVGAMLAGQGQPM